MHLLGIMFKKLNITLVILLNFLLVSCGDHSRNESQIELVKSSIIVSTNKVWPKGKKLIVSYIDGNQRQKKLVQKHSQEWSQFANLDFQFYDSPKLVPAGTKIDILITFNGNRNTSSVGTDSRQYSFENKEPSMTFNGLNDLAGVNRFVILHEFGHALGLEHEHQHIRRDFTFDSEKTKEYYKKTYGFSFEETENFILKTTEEGKNTYFSTYDPSSIMHYKFHSSITKEKIDFKENYSLSLLDKIEIAQLYPGRMTKEKIIESHNLFQEKVKQIEIVGNCQIQKTPVQKMRINANKKAELIYVDFYMGKSLVPDEYTSQAMYEDKETFVEYLKNEEYCQLDELTLKTMREEKLKKQIEARKFGNCEIPLTSEGKPVLNNCPSDFQFQVLKANKDEVRAINSCFQSFNQAFESMKVESYCNLSKSELEAYELKEKNDFLASLKRGKCSVENLETFDLENSSNNVRCRSEYPWFIIYDKDKMLNSSCYSSPISGIEEIKKNPACEN